MSQRMPLSRQAAARRLMVIVPACLLAAGLLGPRAVRSVAGGPSAVGSPRAGSAVLRVTVTDAVDGRAVPVQGQLEWCEGDVSATDCGQGRLNFERLPRGGYTLSIDAVDQPYHAWTGTVRLDSRWRPVDLTVRLRRLTLDPLVVVEQSGQSVRLLYDTADWLEPRRVRVTVHDPGATARVVLDQSSGFPGPRSPAVVRQRCQDECEIIAVVATPLPVDGLRPGAVLTARVTYRDPWTPDRSLTATGRCRLTARPPGPNPEGLQR